MGYFHALKLAFLSSLIRKYMLWEGFYHDFSTKKVSASGGFAPWPPPRGSTPWTPARGSCPLDPRGNFAPSNDLPWRRPCREVISRAVHNHVNTAKYYGPWAKSIQLWLLNSQILIGFSQASLVKGRKYVVQNWYQRRHRILCTVTQFIQRIIQAYSQLCQHPPPPPRDSPLKGEQG